MFHFTGDTLHTAHTSVVAAPSGARTVLAAPQKLNVMHSQASHGLAKISSTNAGSPATSNPSTEGAEPLPERSASAGHPGGTVNPAAAGQGQSVAATTKPLTAGTGTSAAACGSGGSAAAGGAAAGGAAAGGSAAAAPVVAPFVVGATSVAALKQAAVATASKAGQAAPPPPPTSPPPTSPVQHGPRFQKPS